MAVALGRTLAVGRALPKVRCATAWLGIAGLGGCALRVGSLPAVADHLPDQVDLDATPFFPQTAYQCGPAALATVLGAIGIAADPQWLAHRVFLPARQGSLQVEMLGGARQASAVPTRIPGRLDAVLLEIAAGHPVVVLQNLGFDFVPVWHYAVVVGYSLPLQQLVLRSGTTRREILPMALFEHSWVKADRWGVVVLPPGVWPATVQEPEVVEACIGFERAAPAPLAQRAYASAVQRWPGNLALTMGLGNTAFAAGNKVLAADSFETAARRHRSAPAWINLARTLLDAGLADSAWRAALEAEYLNDPAWRRETTAVLRDARVARRANGSGPRSG
ncbi:PA2778 family cysteine peptidase [Piscinibacter sakaiensis]|uniref:PA2778 family cysteine peptidase n=1 Tax=Piscinibacter sakaiensis TaxID=1547922 RepID=UPI003AAE6B0F